METDDHDVAATPDPAESNVVRFPRDWLGPLDELVPFGPSAGQGSDAKSEDSGVLEFTPATPLRAEDFWGEASASIHDALEAPPSPPEAAADGGGSRGARPPRVPHRNGNPVAASGGRPRFSAIRASSICAVAICLAAAGLAIATLRGGASARKPSPKTSAQLAFAGIPPIATMFRRVVPGRRQPVLQVAHRRNRRGKQRVGGAGRGASLAGPVPTPTHDAPPATSEVYARAAVRQTVAPPTSTESQPSATTQRTSSGTSTPESTAASTTEATNRPAFGANGLLGPGSSPNS